MTKCKKTVDESAILLYNNDGVNSSIYTRFVVSFLLFYTH